MVPLCSVFGGGYVDLNAPIDQHSRENYYTGFVYALEGSDDGEERT